MYLLGENDFLIAPEGGVNGLGVLGAGAAPTYGQIQYQFQQILNEFAALPIPSGMESSYQQYGQRLTIYNNQYLAPNSSNLDAQVSESAMSDFNSLSLGFANLKMAFQGQQMLSAGLPKVKGSDFVTLPPPTPAQVAASSPAQTGATATSPFGFIESIFGPIGKAVSSIPDMLTSAGGSIAQAAAKAPASPPVTPAVAAAQAKQATGKQLTPAEALLLSTSQMSSAAQGYASSAQQAYLQQQLAKKGLTFGQQPPKTSYTPWIIGGVIVAGLVAATFMATAKKKD